MSGRHRVVKPRRRFSLVLVVPARAVRRWLLAAHAATARAWARLVERATERFEAGDPFAGVHLDPQVTSPDPIPTPVPVVEPEPAPVTLTPEQALPVLHTQHPHLPHSHIRWHVLDAGVHGEVNALDLDEDGQRRAVTAYAAVFGVGVVEDDDGDRVTVSATGEFASVPVTVTAVFPHVTTIPLRVYRESASTQETQQIPDEVLREVIA